MYGSYVRWIPYSASMTVVWCVTPVSTVQVETACVPSFEGATPEAEWVAAAAAAQEAQAAAAAAAAEAAQQAALEMERAAAAAAAEEAERKRLDELSRVCVRGWVSNRWRTHQPTPGSALVHERQSHWRYWRPWQALSC